MSTKRSTEGDEPARWYDSPNIPMAVIRRYARRIAERFQPDKIILFGSYAYGTPNADSDVDFLVIMPTWDQLGQAFKIRWELPAPFAMDLLVRTPTNLGWRLEEGELFHTEIVTKGKVLYEKGDRRVSAKGGRRLPHRPAKQSKRNPSA
jgi:uncharacterized protein